MENVIINAAALRQVLVALVGPPHLMRELQVTRSSSEPGKLSISDLTGQKNPIDLLVEEFNEQITRGSLRADLFQSKTTTYRVKSGDASGLFIFTATTDHRSDDDDVRLTKYQLGFVNGMHEILTAGCGIFLCKEEGNPNYSVKHSNRGTPPENAAFTILHCDQLRIVESLEFTEPSWTDLDLWKKFFEYFNIGYDFYDKGKIVHKVDDVDVGYGITIDAGTHAKVDGYDGFHANVYFDVDGKFLKIIIIEGFRTPQK